MPVAVYVLIELCLLNLALLPSISQPVSNNTVAADPIMLKLLLQNIWADITMIQYE